MVAARAWSRSRGVALRVSLDLNYRVHVGAELVVVDDGRQVVKAAEHVGAVDPGVVLGEEVCGGQDDEVSVGPRERVGAGHPALGAVVERTSITVTCSRSP